MPQARALLCAGDIPGNGNGKDMEENYLSWSRNQCRKRKMAVEPLDARRPRP